MAKTTKKRATKTSNKKRRASTRTTQATTTSTAPWMKWLFGLLALVVITTVIYLQRQGVFSKQPITTSETTPRIKPTFDFYQMLPAVEVPVTESAPKTKRPVPVTTAPNKATPASTQYVLQVASFKNRTDADALKARLSLLGFDVNVRHYQQAQQQWYRVWVGPYASAQSARRAQAELTKQHINSLLRKVG